MAKLRFYPNSATAIALSRSVCALGLIPICGGTGSGSLKAEGRRRARTLEKRGAKALSGIASQGAGNSEVAKGELSLGAKVNSLGDQKSLPHLSQGSEDG